MKQTGIRTRYKRSESQPYAVTITNPTNQPLPASLFGFNQTYGQPNFGLNEFLKVNCPTGVSYGALLAQSAFKPFTIGAWRISAKGKQVSELCITYRVKDANASEYSRRLLFLVSPNQFQSGIIDGDNVTNIFGSTSLEFDVPENTELTFFLYPSQTLNVSTLLTDDGRRMIKGSADCNMADLEFLPEEEPAPDFFDDEIRHQCAVQEIETAYAARPGMFRRLRRFFKNLFWKWKEDYSCGDDVMYDDGPVIGPTKAIQKK